jgi:photosystem II stability/assembly factor-like uncharacterized protein
MKIKCAAFRIALVVFLLFAITACSIASQSPIETLPVTVEHPTDLPTSTPLPLPTHTTAPTLSPTPEIVWRSLGLANAYINCLAIDPVNPLVLYAGGNDVILKSEDGGESWNKIRIFSAVEPDHIDQILIDPLTPTTIYAAVFNQGLIKSTDAGETWQNINSGLIDFKFRALVMDPINPEILYTGTANGVFKTIDGGDNWGQMDTNLPKEEIYSLAIDPQNPATIYAGLGTGTGLYKSTNSAASWVAKNNGLSVQVGVTPGKSPTWVFAIAVNPQNPDILYAAGYGVFKSMDGGESWQAVNEGLDYSISPPPGDFDKLSINPQNPQIVYATMGRHVVYRTQNGAVTWERYNMGMDEGKDINWYEGPISSVLIDYSDTGTLYVGTFGNGVFTSRMTLLPTTTPTTQPKDCTNGWTQLKVNTYAKVSGDEGDLPNRVRAEADQQSDVTYQLYPGEIVKLIEGPFCTDNLVFWKVENANIPGGTGWTAEGDLHDYWLEPYASE